MIVSVGRLSHRTSQQSPVTRHRLSCERVHLHSTPILKKTWALVSFAAVIRVVA